MRELAERAYFVLCRALGRLLRSAGYSKARIVLQGGKCEVVKRRLFYAPLLVRMSGPLLRILDAGVRILPQRDWEDREREIYRSLRGCSIWIDADRALVLPCLTGETLATLLEQPDLDQSVRNKAIQQAVVALAEFHDRGLTHGDAMAENVMIAGATRRSSASPEQSSKGEAVIAHWFDFETVHEPGRPLVWRRADDVRVLLATCLVRTEPLKFAETLGLILDVYENLSGRGHDATRGAEGVSRVLAASFTSVFRRPLTFHLAQADLPFQSFREISRLLSERGKYPCRGAEGRSPLG